MPPFSHSSAENSSKTNPSINFPISCIKSKKTSRPLYTFGRFQVTLFQNKSLCETFHMKLCSSVLHENEPEGGTHFHMSGFALVLTQKKTTWEWLIFPCILFSFISICLRPDYSDRKLKLRRTINGQEGAQNFKLPS